MTPHDGVAPRRGSDDDVSGGSLAICLAYARRVGGPGDTFSDGTRPHPRASRFAPHLDLEIECERLLAGPARYRLAETTKVLLGRGEHRGATVTDDGVLASTSPTAGCRCDTRSSGSRYGLVHCRSAVQARVAEERSRGREHGSRGRRPLPTGTHVFPLPRLAPRRRPRSPRRARSPAGAAGSADLVAGIRERRGRSACGRAVARARAALRRERHGKGSPRTHDPRALRPQECVRGGQLRRHPARARRVGALRSSQRGILRRARRSPRLCPPGGRRNSFSRRNGAPVVRGGA